MIEIHIFEKWPLARTRGDFAGFHPMPSLWWRTYADRHVYDDSVGASSYIITLLEDRQSSECLKDSPRRVLGNSKIRIRIQRVEMAFSTLYIPTRR